MVRAWGDGRRPVLGSELGSSGGGTDGGVDNRTLASPAGDAQVGCPSRKSGRAAGKISLAAVSGRTRAPPVGGSDDAS